jgi:hypothetical protein
MSNPIIRLEDYDPSRDGQYKSQLIIYVSRSCVVTKYCSDLVPLKMRIGFIAMLANFKSCIFSDTGFNDILRFEQKRLIATSYIDRFFYHKNTIPNLKYSQGKELSIKQLVNLNVHLIDMIVTRDGKIINNKLYLRFLNIDPKEYPHIY